MSYEKEALRRIEEYKTKEKPLILAIESSCDETAAAVIEGGREVLSNSVFTQIPIHKQYGGVVPEIASRSHVEKISGVVNDALESAGKALQDMDAIAVTCGPGLVGALLVGLNYAKGLAFSASLPLIGVDHIAGHIAANYITHKALEPPFVCLVASGGHSHIVKVMDYDRFEVLGKTRDDAAGEAFDKVARALGLGYPGGPLLESLAKDGNPNAYTFKSALNDNNSFEFSFSGIKTAVVNVMHNAKQKGEEIVLADIAASFQHSVVNTLTKKSVHAAKECGMENLALAGGVSANTVLRNSLEKAALKEGLNFYCPSMKYCTDNAAMIGCAGHYSLMKGHFSPLSLNADPSLGF
ncbi:MAG: tRNA (adenosine(37)-N6)-threonylcarbamoyltransferase complex transferase subunit TsaD [Clostridia bacterium]|nr:tRNA (adenosine(37)-N6)-threonylcarbamoyltransferase complex transferase subunit TsaD [Clostridia bacterium]